MSDLGCLSQCMMDSDTEATGRARRRLGRAFAVSIVVESLLVVAMLLLPLLTPGALSTPYILLTPMPPFPGVARTNSAHPPHANPAARRELHPILKPGILYQPTRVPPHVDTSASDEPPTIDETPGNGYPGVPGGFGPGSGLPGVDGSRAIPEPPSPAKPQKVSIGVMEGSLINRVEPVYPALAISAHVSGEVKLRATIGTDGKVKDYEVLNGNPLLARAAIAAVRQWRYRATLLNGEAVEVDTFITVNFVLDK
jgi:protein TonB